MARIDDLKKQYPEFNITLIDLIDQCDPTKTHKYLGFMLRIIRERFSEHCGELYDTIATVLIDEDELELLKKFETHCKAQRIKKNDITQYLSFEDIEVSVEEAEEIVRKKELEKQKLAPK